MDFSLKCLNPYSNGIALELLFIFYFFIEE